MIISAEALKNGADGTDDTLRKILGSLKLSAEGKDEYKNGTYKGSSNVTLLTDIPSGIFDEPVGTLKAVCNITSSGGKKNESIKLPEKFKNGNIK